MPEYVKHKTWTTDGKHGVIHLYEVDQADKHLIYRRSYDSEFELEFAGFRRLKDLLEFLNGR